MDRDIGVVDSSVGLVDEVAHVDLQRLAAGEYRGIAGDVLVDGPGDAGGAAGLSGAAAEELGAGDPDAEYAVELAAGAGCGPLEHGEGRAAAADAGGRGVRGGDGGLPVGGGEVVLEEENGAGFGVGGSDRLRDLEERGWGPRIGLMAEKDAAAAEFIVYCQF